jgi:hypothetical protein
MSRATAASEGRAEVRHSERREPLFWLSAAAGWAVIGWGIRGVLHHHVDTRPAELGRFFVGGDLLHDLIFAPVLLAGGLLISRVVPGRARGFVQAALLISGCAALFAWPEIRDYARVNHNPTSLPHNYTANLLVVVAAVCASTTVVAVMRRRRRSP